MFLITHNVLVYILIFSDAYLPIWVWYTMRTLDKSGQFVLVLRFTQIVIRIRKPVLNALNISSHYG